MDGRGELSVRVEFLVSQGRSGWIVKRGHTTALRYETRDGAIRAAENLARAAAKAGDRALVKLVVGGSLQETLTFEPDTLRLHHVAAAPAPRLA